MSLAFTESEGEEAALAWLESAGWQVRNGAAVRQIISRAVAPEGVVDIFAAAGLTKPDISILSEGFLAEMRGMPQRNLAVELLQKLLMGELATRRRKNAVQAVRLSAWWYSTGRSMPPHCRDRR